MSEDEVEKFEITDYDLDNEFNMFRNRRNLSKNQQIYGIWADDSDNEERQGSSKAAHKAKDYSAPIGFVAGGVHQVGKKKDENIKKESESEDENERELYSKIKNSSSDSDSDDVSIRAGFGQRKKSTVTDITGDIAGLRKHRAPLNPALIRQGVGHWEKHTKGIGAKLLLQMGFQPGKGLGKDLQGISAPVEAHVRKGRGAIGAYGPEKAAKVPELKVQKQKNESAEEGEYEIENEKIKWKKGEITSKKKTRYYYRSVDDVIERGKRPGALRTSSTISELSKVKVIDMTGPQQRVLSGYHALSGPKAPPGVELYEDVIHKQCANFTLPEIQHNLDLLVDMCEQDIILCDRNTRHCQDRIIALKQEESSLKTVLKKEKESVDTLENVLETVIKLMDQSQGFSLGQVAQTFKDLQNNHYEEYYIYELGELAPGLVGPLITSALASWSPLTFPKQHMDIFSQWKDILDKQNKHGTLDITSGTIQPYDSLVWNTWMPVIRSCISTWNCRDCEPLIDLLEIWMPILSPWIMDNILDQLVVPRISAEVNIWNPLTDTLPIHVWIHPWIPLLGSRIHTSVFPLIQDKLGSALANWHPSDRSAKLMLHPWQAALPEGVFSAFLHKHIVSKLHLCMQNLVINPHQQHLDAWNWVMDWSDLISTVGMTHLLDKCFFPRWLQTLALWLNHNPDFAQVTEWYSGWKRMLSDSLLAQPTVKDHFHKALEMMNRAVGTGQQPGALESVSYLTNIETNIPPPPPPPRLESMSETLRTASMIPQGFKDLIAKRFEERGILFVPIPNRYHEAKQVYRIGSNTQCYIDRNVVFVSKNGSSFLPISLSKLLDIAT